MLNRRLVMFFTAAFFAAPTLSAQTAQTALTPEQALAGMNDDALILIDVRRPEEWQQTGVADGAWLLDMTDKQFGPRLMAVRERNPNHKVAIICRTGNRTGHIMKVLAQNGIHDVLDVSSGMAGGPRGKGWIPSGLPTVTPQEAIEAMPKDLKKL